jgi:hypothetical protein
MLAKVQHLGITTPIVGMDGLCLNHRCAVWLNGAAAARQIKNDAIEAKAKASSDKADKLRVQAVNKAARLVVQNAKSDPEPTELFLPSVNSYCEHFSCANEYRIGIPGQPSWLQCCTCKKFVCHLINRRLPKKDGDQF